MTALHALSGGLDAPVDVPDLVAALEAAVGALALAEVETLADQYGGPGALSWAKRRVLLADARHQWMRKVAGYGDRDTWERLRAVGRGES